MESCKSGLFSCPTVRTDASSYGNRNLFYGNEDKINMRLPSFIAEFQRRLLLTVKETLRILS